MNSENLTVVHIAAYYPPHLGGLEHVAQTISNMLAAKGKRVLVLTSDKGAPSGTTHEEALTVKRLWSVEFAHTPLAPSLLWNLFTLPKRSIIHFHLSQAYWPELTLLVCKLRGIPYIVHFHLDVEPSGFFGFLFPLYKKMIWGPFLQNAKTVVACSQAMAVHIAKTFDVSAENISVIPNGVRQPFFNPRPYEAHTDTLQLLSVGRLAPQKRLDRILKALSLVTEKVHLTIVGDGEERAALEQLAGTSGLTHVVFVGAKNDAEMAEYHAQSDVFLTSTSKEGGTPLAVLEAMAGGLPVIASDVEGVHELVSGVGILVSEPYPEEFAKAITLLAQHKERLALLSAQSRDKAAQFAWPQLIHQVEKLYQ